MQIQCDLDVQICKLEFYIDPQEKELRGRQTGLCLPTKFARHVSEYLAGLTKDPPHSWHIGQVGKHHPPNKK